MLLSYYLQELNYDQMPEYLKKYMLSDSLKRLKHVSYFCGMDYASKDIYQFKEKITRFDHSLTTALLVNKFATSKEEVLAALFHDVATPCFSHVIDYMNKDYETQESTEEYTEYILKKDKYILECLKKDKISIHDLIDFKKYSLVDNERPRVCADRLDGVILNGISWTKTMTPEKIQNILNSLAVFQNEEGEKEIGFTSFKVAHDVMKESFLADSYCHSKEDNYMMELLAHITSLAIQKNYVSYENLYTYKEDQVFYFLKSIPDKELRSLIYKFEHIKEKDIPNIEMPYIKQRILRPMVNGQRIAKSS